MIFDEKRVSADNSVACNTCHSPRNGFTTHTETSRGVGDQIGKRNAPSILNAMFYKSMFWDGRAATLEEQATLPILNPVEMGQKDPKDVVAKLAAIPEIVEAFQKVFGRPPNWEDMGKALAAFERTRLSTEAPFDRFLRGDQKALNASQQRGWSLFTGKARCGTLPHVRSGAPALWRQPLPQHGSRRAQTGFQSAGHARRKERRGRQQGGDRQAGAGNGLLGTGPFSGYPKKGRYRRL